MLCSWPVYCASPSSPEGRFQQVAPGKQQSVILQSQVSLEIPSSSNHSVTLIVNHIKGWRTTVPVCRKKDIFALSGMSYKLSCTNFSFPLTAFSVYRDTVVAFSAHSHFGRQMPNSAFIKCSGYLQASKTLLLAFIIRSEHATRRKQSEVWKQKEHN